MSLRDGAYFQRSASGDSQYVRDRKPTLNLDISVHEVGSEDLSNVIQTIKDALSNAGHSCAISISGFEE